MKSLKTPLRYPGGKSRALTKIIPHIPDLSEYQEYREPFLGGGSVAIHITKMYPDLNIWVNDFYTPLVTFWQQRLGRGDLWWGAGARVRPPQGEYRHRARGGARRPASTERRPRAGQEHRSRGGAARCRGGARTSRRLGTPCV